MKKIILITPTLENGVYYHRLETPYTRLHEEGFADVIVTNFKSLVSRIHDFEKYIADVYIFNRVIGVFDSTLEEEADLIKAIKAYGGKIIVDFDDYWILSEKHILHEKYKEHNQTARQIHSLKIADAVTCTTEYLAAKIRKHNKNVTVCPNALDPENHAQWSQEYTNCPRVNFGYVGVANAHLEDVDLFKRGIRGMYDDKTLTDKWGIAQCGFIPNDDPSHKLQNIMKGGYIQTPEYVAMRPREKYTYGTFYQHIDVSLVPLANSEFNRSKSQLKLIEAAFTNTAVICSPTHPYLIDGIDKKNVLFADKPNDWYKAMKKIITSKTLLNDLKGALSELKSKYHIKNVNQTRKDLINNL